MRGGLVFADQRQQQAELELAAAAGRGEVGIDAGAQNTHRLLLAVQTEEPEFLILRIDAPARTITLCAVPGQTLVDAPQGRTTLADCYLAAGLPARRSCWKARWALGRTPTLPPRPTPTPK